jgi:TolA-binding protein
MLGAPVSKVVALQGADVIAAETYQYAKECLKSGKGAVANAHFRDYLRRQ